MQQLEYRGIAFWGEINSDPGTDGGADEDSPADSIGFSAAPPFISTFAKIPVRVDYLATERRDLVIELFNSSGWIAQKKVTVNAGERAKTLAIDNPGLEAGAHQLKISIRPEGGNWQSALQEQWLSTTAIADRIGRFDPPMSVVVGEPVNIEVAVTLSTSSRLVLHLEEKIGNKWTQIASQARSLSASDVSASFTLSDLSVQDASNEVRYRVTLIPDADTPSQRVHQRVKVGVATTP